jgi:Methyltransferase domain
MYSVTRFHERLDRLLRIMNLPARLGWIDPGSPRHVYDYWYGIGLLDQSKSRAVASGSAPLLPTRIIERFFRGIDYHWNPSLYAGETAIDLGSGYGHLTFWLLLSGAAHVVATGDPDRVDFITRLAGAACREGLLDTDRLTPYPHFVQAGDRTLCSEIRPGSVSLILLNDTLEHIHPRIVPSLFRSAFADLKAGGRIVARQHNTSSPETLRRAQELWEQMDREQFLQLREELLRTLRPSLAEREIDQLAAATRGQDREDIEETLIGFESTGTLPTPTESAPAIHPLIGEPCEGDTSIPRIIDEMKKAGFRCRAYPGMTHSRRSLWLQSLAKLWPWPFLTLHIFDEVSVFVGRKSPYRRQGRWTR